MCTVCQQLRSAPTYISWGKGTSQAPTVTILFLFPSRGASVLRAELQQCQLQHQQRQLAPPAPSPLALRTPGRRGSPACCKVWDSTRRPLISVAARWGK